MLTDYLLTKSNFRQDYKIVRGKDSYDGLRDKLALIWRILWYSTKYKK